MKIKIPQRQIGVSQFVGILLEKENIGFRIESNGTIDIKEGKKTSESTSKISKLKRKVSGIPKTLEMKIGKMLICSIILQPKLEIRRADGSPLLLDTYENDSADVLQKVLLSYPGCKLDRDYEWFDKNEYFYFGTSAQYMYGYVSDLRQGDSIPVAYIYKDSIVISNPIGGLSHSHVKYLIHNEFNYTELSDERINNIQNTRLVTVVNKYRHDRIKKAKRNISIVTEENKRLFDSIQSNLIDIDANRLLIPILESQKIELPQIMNTIGEVLQLKSISKYAVKEKLIFRTEPIFYTAKSKTKYFFGVYDICFNIGDMDSIRMNNVAYRTYSGNKNHPHVFSNGRACWGTPGPIIADAILDFSRLKDLVYTCVSFLKTCDEEEMAGRSFVRFFNYNKETEQEAKRLIANADKVPLGELTNERYYCS